MINSYRFSGLFEMIIQNDIKLVKSINFKALGDFTKFWNGSFFLNLTSPQPVRIPNAAPAITSLG